MQLQSLVPTLQVAIGPMILVSGIGLLLLSMTNRFGRIIDRARILAREHRSATAEEKVRAAAQLQILLRRSRIIRAAIAAGGISVLLASLVVIGIFLGALLQIEITAPLVGGLFVGCMGCLIVSLVLFIADINLSLRALKLEIGDLAG